MKCPSCGAENSLTANFCSNCGFALVDNAGTQVGSRQELPCRECGTAVPVGAQFCGNCGATDPHRSEPAPDLRQPPVGGAADRAEEHLTAPRGKVDPTQRSAVRDAKDTPVVPPPPKTAGSPVAVPEGWPDVTEELAEVRFQLLQGEDEEARAALKALQDRFPGHPDLDTELVLDRSVMRRAPEDPDSSAADDAAEKDTPIEDPAESAKTMVPTPERTAPAAVAGEVSATVIASAKAAPVAVSGTVVQRRPEAESADDTEAELPADALDDTEPAEFPAEIVAKSAGWGSAPAPGGTVISRAPSADQPNVLPVGTESSAVQLSETGEVAETGDPSGSPNPVRHEVSATVIRSSPKGSTVADAPPPSDRTVVSKGLQKPKPFDKRHKGDEWLEGGKVEEVVVARPARPRGPKHTMVPSDPERPSPPAPFGGEAPPGSTMVPGTTPPKGGFPPSDSASDTPSEPPSELASPEPTSPEPSSPEADFEQRLPLAARGRGVDDDEMLATAEMPAREPPEDEVPLTPLPHVPTTTEIADRPAEPKTSAIPGEVVPSGAVAPELVRAMTAPLRTDDPVTDRGSQTPQGTVITVNPLPPAPYDGRPPTPILPVRLVMLGSRGQPVAERTLAPGETLDIGRDQSEPWGDDEYLADEHARIRPAPGGGVMVDDLDGKGPVYRQIEHRRQIRAGDQFRVGQSLVTFVRDDEGSRLDVLHNSEGEPKPYPLGDGGIILGREDGEILFPDDTYVSASHCRFTEESGTAFVEDLGSSNGTYVRVRPEDTIEFGALLLVGHTQFRVQALPGD